MVRAALQFIKRLFVPFLAPLLVIFTLLRLFRAPVSEILGWELASLLHTVFAAYTLMNIDLRVQGIAVEVLQRLKFTVMVAIGMILGAKIMLSLLELEHHSDLLEFVDKWSPHLIVAPILLFFGTNLVMFILAGRKYSKVKASGKPWQSYFSNLMLQTDLPVVTVYAIIVGTSLISPESRGPVFYRGVACTLLTFSNTLSIIYELRHERIGQIAASKAAV